MKYELLFAGAGGAFAPQGLWQNQCALTIGAKKSFQLWIDASADIRHSIGALGMSAKNIKHIYISHLHQDHIGGLEYIGFHRYFGKQPKARLYVPKPVLAYLWDALPGMHVIDTQPMELSDFFDVVPLTPGMEHLVWIEDESQHVIFECFAVKHITDSLSSGESYALSVSQENAEGILFSTDARFPEHFDESSKLYLNYSYNDVIVHDCADYDTPNLVHARMSDLTTLEHFFKEKMILCHHSNNLVRDPVYANQFAGIAQPNTVFSFELRDDSILVVLNQNEDASVIITKSNYVVNE